MLPHEQMVIYVNRKKITGDIAKSLRNAFSHKYIQSFFKDKGTLSDAIFDCIHWE